MIMILFWPAAGQEYFISIYRLLRDCLGIANEQKHELSIIRLDKKSNLANYHRDKLEVIGRRVQMSS